MTKNLIYRSVKILIEHNPFCEMKLRKCGIEYFKKHVMHGEYDWKKYSKIKNSFWKKWGFYVPVLESKYYSEITGVEADYYVPCFVMYNIITPYLCRNDFMSPLLDKNLMHKLLNLSNCSIEVRFPKIIIYNSNGLFYKGDDVPCSREEAVRIILKYDNDLILKPTQYSTWGAGVRKLRKQELSENLIISIFDEYIEDFNFQECVQQHKDFSVFNNTSVNTIRVNTYRSPSKKIKVIAAMQRFGAKGSVIDNASAGGQILSIDENGIYDNKARRYTSQELNEIDLKGVQKVPKWENLIKACIELHRQLPTFDLIGWDMSVSEDGVPIVIEFNNSPGIELVQFVKGPFFSKEELEELMPHVIKFNARYSLNCEISFSERKLNSRQRPIWYD